MSMMEFRSAGLKGLLEAATGIVQARMSSWAPEPRLLESTGCRRIYHVHMRKSGGTSLDHAFFAVGGEEAREIEWRMRHRHFTRSGPFIFTTSKRLISSGRYYYASCHLPFWQVRLPADTFTCTVVRDPLSRVISLYKYLRDPASDDGYAFPAPEHERAKAAGSLDDFLTEMPRSDILNQLWMFSPSFDPAEAAERLAGMGFVLRTESLGADIAALGTRVGQDLQARHERSSAPAPAPSESSVARLREMLQPEYEMIERLYALRSERESATSG